MGIRPYGLSWAFEAFLEHFRSAVETALREHVDVIVFAGDLFDKPKPANKAIKTVMDVVSEAVGRGVRVYSVLGEHDLPKIAGEIPAQLLVRELRVFSPRGPGFDCFSIGGVEYCIGGVSHYPLKYGGQKKRLLDRITRVVSAMNNRSVLVLHQNISQFNMFEPGLDLNELPSKPRYIAMGHIHRRIIHELGNGRLLAYPGSLDIVRRDEIELWRRDGKGFYIVDLSGDEPGISKVDVEVVPQALVKTSLENLRADVMRALRELPRDRESILHVEVSLKITEKTDIHAIIRNIIRQYGGRIYYRVQKKYVDEAVRIESGGPERIDEAEVIAELLGGRNYRDLAVRILDLKKALLQGDEQLVEKIIEEISSHPYWYTRAKIPQVLVKPLKPLVEAKKTGGERGERRGGRKDLLSFLE